LVLVAGAYFAASRVGRRWPFLALTGLTLLGRWAALVSGDARFELGSSVITVAWIGAAIAIVGTELFRQRSVTTNMIFGAIVAYLLAAVGFAYLFEVLERLQPGAFSGIPEGASAEALGDALLYFSLVTLTTLGYGDIVPASGLARPIAVLEGVFGTLYLAVMIARLVGLHIAAGFVVDVGFTVDNVFDTIVLVTCLVLASSTSRPLHVAGLSIVWIAYITGAVLETWA
jgi:hypothetical protein